MNRFGIKTNRIMLLFGNSAGGKRIILFFLCFLYAFFALSLSASAKGIYDPVTVQIPVYCDKVSNTPKANYEIHMDTVSAGAPAPASDTITVDAAKVGYFELTVNEPETLQYRIYQKKGSEGSIKYDDKVYDVYVCVVNDANNELTYTLSVTLAGSATKPDHVGFTNIKKTTPQPSEETPPPASEEPPKKKSGASSSKTGDQMWKMIAIYGSVMGVLLIGAVIYIVIKKRKSKAAEDMQTKENEV